MNSSFKTSLFCLYHMLYLSLGTNLGDRYDNIDRAIFLIKQRLENVTMVAPSIETAPVGFESKNNFLNTVVEVETKKSVEEILHITQSIEQEMGRTQKSVDGQYHDRIIDIDILFYDDIEVHTPQLQLPHPHIAQRLFVLEPLAQVNPDLVHPYYGKTIAQLLAERECCSIDVLSVSEVTPQLCIRINQLLAQLSTSAHTLTVEELTTLCSENNSNTDIYLLRLANNELVGMATLSYCHLITGTKAWIEDVVVDEKERGKGLARILLTHLQAEARNHGVDSLNLTSRPSRKSANHLYRSMGFEPRETNVYKMKF